MTSSTSMLEAEWGSWQWEIRGLASRPMMPIGQWTFITNHGLVLNHVFHNPRHTAREIANQIGVTERTAHKIVSDLETAGYIERRKSGRRNVCRPGAAASPPHQARHPCLRPARCADGPKPRGRWSFQSACIEVGEPMRLCLRSSSTRTSRVRFGYEATLPVR